MGTDIEEPKEVSLKGTVYGVDDEVVMQTAEALHNSLAFYLKRYEGVEITAAQDVYGIAKKPWSELCKENRWAKEWLCRAAVDMLEQAALQKGTHHG